MPLATPAVVLGLGLIWLPRLVLVGGWTQLRSRLRRFLIGAFACALTDAA